MSVRSLALDEPGPDDASRVVALRTPVLRVLASHAVASVAMSIPWPLLLLLVWRDTGSDAWLGVAAAARMAPYVVLSWWVARLADRVRRDRLVRTTLVLRALLLTGTAVSISAGSVTAAVALCTLAVAVATPAYPALAAGMPRLAGASSRRATDLLVTIEVASFVVGPALGGLLLGASWLVGPVAVVSSVVAWGLYAGIRQPRPIRVEPADPGASAPVEPVESRRLGGGGLVAIAVLVAVNVVVTVTGVALLPLAERVWTGDALSWADASAYGLATAALGFGALGGPFCQRRGDETMRRLGRGLVVAGVALVATVVTPTVLWAAMPLLVVGALAVNVEAAATELLQDSVPDHRRAGMLGVADSAMVAAAMVGALAAPTLAGWWGPQPLVAVLALLCLAVGTALPRWARSTLPARAAPPAGRTPAVVEVNTLVG